ncbi:unnamed protein product [Heligmosomoides polygyrus]|uniref:4F5 domain-containing protein n=1 Tax=Heligmosomoides polygyrus TaxID=6339 RepID=A0A183F4C5_HELPZ|nr:unnamed protein product [Heligmosomoides polygyrus]
MEHKEVNAAHQAKATKEKAQTSRSHETRISDFAPHHENANRTGTPAAKRKTQDKIEAKQAQLPLQERLNDHSGNPYVSECAHQWTTGLPTARHWC